MNLKNESLLCEVACYHCGFHLYAGEKAIYYDNVPFCSESCIGEYTGIPYSTLLEIENMELRAVNNILRYILRNSTL